MLKYIYGFLIAIVILAAIAEVVLRFAFGFCNSPLYVSDPDFEYIYAPNQNVKRFGSVLRTNKFSMRNEEVLPSDTLVILLIGDSVVNGGSLTDQENIASTIMEKRFLKDFNKRVRVLNISAGSWGPDNMAAYLKKFGLFNAKLMCLVTSSHDSHDIMSPQSLVGIDPQWPDKQYKVALYELWDRYRWMFFYYFNTVFFAPANQEQDTIVLTDSAQNDSITGNDTLVIDSSKEISSKVLSQKKLAIKDSIRTKELNDAGIRKPGVGFNPGYEQLYEMAKANNIPFFIYLHPEISEVEMGHFNDQGDEIISFAKEKDIRLINEFKFGITKKLYRKSDVVHYNDEGQVFLTDNLYPLFKDYLKTRL